MADASEYQFSVVLPEHYDLVFPHIVGFMERLERRFHGADTVESMTSEIESGKLSLWIIYRGSRIVAFFTLGVVQTAYRRYLSCPHVAGEEMEGWYAEGMELVKRFGREQGCTHMETYGRPGWGKFHEKLGGRKTRVTYEFKLEE